MRKKYFKRLNKNFKNEQKSFGAGRIRTGDMQKLVQQR
jgi:hypothetical protein